MNDRLPGSNMRDAQPSADWWHGSLRNRMLVQSVLVCVLVLMVACTGLVIFDHMQQRKSLRNDMNVMARMLAERSAAAIAFDDHETADAQLGALVHNPAVIGVCMYRKTDQQGALDLFAQYRRDRNRFMFCPPDASRSLGIRPGQFYEDGTVGFVAADIMLDGDKIGEVVALADFAISPERLSDYIAASLGSIVGASLLSLLLSIPLVRIITRPLMKLRDTALAIAAHESYHLRAEKLNADEIGNVVDAFNSMLDIIERSHIELRDSEEKFRLLSEASAFGIFQLDARGKPVYINQRLCQMTGLSRQQMLNSGWLDAVHQDDREMFRHTMENAIRLRRSEQIEGRLQLPDGRVTWVNLRIAPIYDADGQLSGFMGAAADVSEIKIAQEQMEQMAFYDPLTLLANRRLFRIQLEKSLLACERRAQGLALLMMDIDLFKHVNDTLGHDAGDEMLVEAAARIKQCVRSADTVARFGGDEFVVLLDGVDSVHRVTRVANAIADALRKPMVLGGHTLTLTTSIGIVLAPRDGKTEQQLLKNADLALYRAKEAGRNTYRFYTQDMNARIENFLKIEQDLRSAVDRNELILHFQPQMDLRNNRIVGFEALVRWVHPERGMVSPLEFIPVAEETGLIVPIGRWIMREAVLQLQVLQREGLVDEQVTMAVNLSTKQFANKDFVNEIEQLLNETGIAPGNLDLELTESILMENINSAKDVLNYLRQRGITLSVDDFGTGYSSLSYLKTLPVNVVKVDRSFVKDIPNDREDMEITSAIVAMTHKLNYRVVAEGIETIEQLNFLRQCGCDIGQGYLISKPLAAPALREFCEQWQGSHFPMATRRS